jgi:hypothetical protein
MPEQLMKLVYTKTKLAASGKDIMQKKKWMHPATSPKKPLSGKNTGSDCIFPKLCVGAYCRKCEDNGYELWH